MVPRGTRWTSIANGARPHPCHQLTDGVGLVSTRDSDVVRITASETVKCPADEEHWHGATNTPLMAHIAMVVANESGDGTTWLEPVTDEQFTAALDATGR